LHLSSYLTVIVIFFGISLFVFGISNQEAFAETITWSGKGDGINWSDPTNWNQERLPEKEDSIIIDNNNEVGSEVHLDIDFILNGSLLIDGNDLLVIDNGVSFVLFGNIDNIGILENFGQINNSGVIGNNESGIINNIGSVIDNKNGGTINNNHKLATINNKNGGTINNNIDSSINNYSGKINNINSVIKNKGTMKNFDVIINNDDIINDHIIENNSIIYIHCNGQIIGNDIAVNPYQNRCKTWNGEEKGKWNVHDNWLPPGMPETGDEILIDNSNWNKKSQVILESDFVNTSGISIDDGDSLTIISGVTLTNKGSIIQNYGTINLHGHSHIKNIDNGQIINAGTINNNFSTILNENSIIKNQGIINNDFYGSIINANYSIIDNTFGMINNTSKITNDCNSNIVNIPHMFGSPITSIPCIDSTYTKEKSSDINVKNTCHEKLKQTSIYVTVDKEHYNAGDTIVITGCIDNALSLSDDLNLQILNRDNQAIKVDLITLDTDGSFYAKYTIDDKFELDGKYFAIVESGGYSLTKTFTVPEFGILTVLILVIGFMSIIVIGSKFGVITGITRV